MRSRVALALAMIVIAVPPSVAQDYAPLPLSGIGFTNAMIFGEEQARTAEKAPPGKPVLAAPKARMTYVASATRRQANMGKFVASLRLTDPKAAGELARFFAANDVIGSLEPELAVFGLRTDNVADAYAIWWISAWQVAHGITAETTRTQALAVKRQAEARIGATALAFGPDGARQDAAETLLVQAAMIEVSADAAKGNMAMLQRVRAAVRQAARTLRVDLDRVTLTDMGFVPSRVP
jgi:hypothetical protein